MAVELLNLFSRKGAVVDTEVIDRAGIELRGAGSREEIEGVTAKVVRIRRSVQTPVHGLQYAIHIELYFVPSCPALVKNHREVVPDSGRGLAVAVSHNS